MITIFRLVSKETLTPLPGYPFLPAGHRPSIQDILSSPGSCLWRLSLAISVRHLCTWLCLSARTPTQSKLQDQGLIGRGAATLAPRIECSALRLFWGRRPLFVRRVLSPLNVATPKKGKNTSSYPFRGTTVRALARGRGVALRQEASPLHTPICEAKDIEMWAFQFLQGGWEK